jgi:nucleotide-binding universal stress UspA family protein
MKTIIAPVNFSPSSTNAARYASDMALAINGDLQLLHVLTIPMTSQDVPLTEYIMEELEASAVDSLNELKDELTKRTKGKIQISNTIEVGAVEYRIKEFCQKLKPFAVVMGATGNSIQKTLVGSTTTSTIHKLPYPLIIIPSDAIFHSIKKIVLVCDPNDLLSDTYIDSIGELKSVFKASFEVINIVPDKDNSLVKDEDSFAYNSWNKKLREIHPEVRFIRSKNVEDGITKYLFKNQPDLLLVFPKKHNFLEFHRSNAKKIVKRSTVPVMSIHA